MYSDDEEMAKDDSAFDVNDSDDVHDDNEDHDDDGAWQQWCEMQYVWKLLRRHEMMSVWSCIGY